MIFYRYTGVNLGGISSNRIFYTYDRNEPNPYIHVVDTGICFTLIANRFKDSKYLGELTDKERFLFELAGQIPGRFKYDNEC